MVSTHDPPSRSTRRRSIPRRRWPMMRMAHAPRMPPAVPHHDHQETLKDHCHSTLKSMLTVQNIRDAADIGSLSHLIARASEQQLEANREEASQEAATIMAESAGVLMAHYTQLDAMVQVAPRTNRAYHTWRLPGEVEFPLSFSRPAPTYPAHLYLLRLDGVRCERHVGLIFPVKLEDEARLPPIDIFPNDILRRTAELVYDSEMQLTETQLRECFRFHRRARMITQPAGVDPAPAHSPVEPSGGYIPHTRHPMPDYALVPLQNKSPDEAARQEAEQWPRVDVTDEMAIGDDDVVRTILLQQAGEQFARTSMPTGTSAHEDEQEEEEANDTPTRDRASIDYDYMLRFDHELLRHRFPPGSVTQADVDAQWREDAPLGATLTTELRSRLKRTSDERTEPRLAGWIVAEPVAELHGIRTLMWIGHGGPPVGGGSRLVRILLQRRSDCTPLVQGAWLGLREARFDEVAGLWKLFDIDESAEPPEYESDECPSPASIDALADWLVARPRSTVLQTPYNGRLYLNLGKTTDLTANSPFPNKEFASYAEYYEKRWPEKVKIVDPTQPLLVAVNYATTPLNVLQPHVLTDKKKHSQEPEMLLVPDATVVWATISGEMVQLLRMIPSILYRLDQNLAQLTFCRLDLGVDLALPTLNMALTSGNAQENYALKPLEHPTNPPATAHASRWQFIPPTMVHSYERLKFIGDSLMKLIVCKLLLIAYPHDVEEALTRRKGMLLNMNRLAMIGAQRNVHQHMITEPFRVEEFVPTGMRPTLPAAAAAATSKRSQESRQISKHVLADCVSALVGAAWLDGGEAKCVQTMIALGIFEPTFVALAMGAHFVDDRPNERHLHVYARMNALAPSSTDPSSSSSVSGVPAAGLTMAAINEYSSSLRKTVDLLPACQEMLGYQFANPALLVQAFTHGSWEGRDTYRRAPDGVSVALPNFERLELLGDAVLELCVSTFLYHAYPFCYLSSSGDLTFMRQRLVNNELLVRVMIDQGLHHLILHTSEPVRAAIDAYAQQSRQMGKQAQGAKPISPPKMLADVFEALLGAVYQDSRHSLQAVWDVFCHLVHFEVADRKKLEVRARSGKADHGEGKPIAC